MRRHASLMNTAIQLARSGPTEEQREVFANQLVSSFNDAQSAWDAYRAHLVEHGLLPALPFTRDVA